MKKRMNADNVKAANVKVGCLTADFAMQVIAIHICFFAIDIFICFCVCDYFVVFSSMAYIRFLNENFQNVLIQMGLNVISMDGMLIRRAKSFVLRCYACFK